MPIFIAFMRKRAIEKAAMRIAILTPRCRADGVTLGLLLTLMFWGGILLRCGDVERNPGPPKSLKQGKLLTTSGDRRSRADRASDAGSDAGSGKTASSSPPEQHTLADIVTTLHSLKSDMNSKFDETEQRDKMLSDQYASLQGGVNELMEEVRVLRKDNEDLKRKNSELTDRVSDLEGKVDDLEGRSKRSNLIFYGMPRDRNETNVDCEDNVRKLITDKLELKKSIDFDRVHRISSKPDSPIIACCSSYKDKVLILKAKRKLKDSNVFIGEDFSGRVREIRKKLSPHLKSAKRDGKRASMIFDHLIVDGKRYFLGDQGNLVERR